MEQSPNSTEELTDIDETEKERWRASLSEGKCPDCGGTKFFRGPEGGGSVNYYCADPECASGWNVAAFSGEVIYAERIGNGKKRFPNWYKTPDTSAEIETNS